MSPPNILEMLSVVTLPLVGLVAFSSYSSSLLFEFSVSVVLQYLAFLLPSYIPLMYAALLPFCRPRWSADSHNAMPEASIALDIHRALIQITTTVCIFMCDFPFWIERFGKVDGVKHITGMGFMDSGLGAFLYNAGLFSTRASRNKTLTNILYLLSLGFIRLAVVKYCGLYVNPREYGCHLNFYFTLAFIDILFLLFDSRHNLLVGASLLLFHEFVLIPNYGPVIMSEDRSNLFLQNKEGLFSIIPYFGCFLLANYMGTIILSKLPLRSKIFYDILFVKIALAVYWLSSLRSPANRILSNLPFTSAVMLIQIYSNTMCMAAAKYFAGNLGSLRMIRFISRNMLLVFLYGNLLVLLFKLVWDGSECSAIQGHIANAVYLLLNFVAFPALAGHFKLGFIKTY